MSYNNLQELKDLIAAKLTVDEILDILGWDVYDLVDVLEEYIDEMKDDFQEACE